jgi:hypothetical protein
MKNGIILAAFMAALCTSAETVKTATQPWVRSYVATNHTDVTCKADKTNVYTKAETDAKIVELAPTPGDYATVSNKAMTAIQSHQSLWPAVEASTNYTDAATNSLAASIGPGDIISDGTNTIDAARTVYGLSYMPWYVYSVGETAYSPPVACDYRASIETDQGTVSDGWLSRSKVNGSYVYIRISARDCYYLFDPQDGVYPVGSGDGITVGSQTNIIELGFVECDIRRASEFGPVPVGKLAMTNDIEEVIREHSLVGIYDSELGVWWTPHMANGAYYWTATTNVNLNAEGN